MISFFILFLFVYLHAKQTRDLFDFLFDFIFDSSLIERKNTHTSDIDMSKAFAQLVHTFTIKHRF